jgi:hypothetical protein
MTMTFLQMKMMIEPFPRSLSTVALLLERERKSF